MPVSIDSATHDPGFAMSQAELFEIVEMVSNLPPRAFRLAGPECTNSACRQTGSRTQLTNEELIESVIRFPAPAEWFEEEMSGLYE